MARIIIFLSAFTITTSYLEAYIPECPYFNNKKSCLEAVEKGYQNHFEYIRDEYTPESTPPLVNAALDIHKFEAQACERTCYN